MRIHLTSVLVDDQDKALRFCTDVFGFAKKPTFPSGRRAGSPSWPPRPPKARSWS